MPQRGLDFVTRWDLDQTYLTTDLDALRNQWWRALDRAGRRHASPGAAAVLRELGGSGARIHILSARPQRLRASLQEKLALDRIRWDELTLDSAPDGWLRWRWPPLPQPLGHQLPALLEARIRDQRRPGDDRPLPELLVGDTEADAFVFSLYADVLTGRVPRSLLTRVLRQGKLRAGPVERCLEALSRLSHGPIVERVLVRLNERTPPSDFDQYGARLVPFHNFLQAAFVLVEDRRLAPEAAVRVASAFVLRHHFDGEALARSYLDLMRRGHAHGALVEPLYAAVEQLGSGRDPPSSYVTLRAMCELLRQYVAQPPTRTDRRPGEPNYVALARLHRG